MRATSARSLPSSTRRFNSRSWRGTRPSRRSRRGTVATQGHQLFQHLGKLALGGDHFGERPTSLERRLRTTPIRSLHQTCRQAWRAALQPGHLRVVCVADRSPKAVIKLLALEDDLLRVYRLDSIQRDTELACILHVHQQPIRRDVPYRAELFATIGHEGLVSDFDLLSHDPSPMSSTGTTVPDDRGKSTRASAAHGRSRSTSV